LPELRRIRDHVALTLTEDALRAPDPRGLIELDQDDDTELARGDIDIAPLDRLVESTIARFTAGDTAMDRHLALQLHRLLPITRREAGDRRLWAWLGMARYPHFVAHRWLPGRSGIRAEERFQGDRVRQAFARLWWAVELSADGDDHALTDRMFALEGFQDLYESVFGRAFATFRPALAAFVDVVGNHPEAVVRETAKELNYLLTTLVLETLSDDDLRTELAELVRTVEGRVLARE
jgi:hypothetical protein